jgi:hypothetical protein
MGLTALKRSLGNTLDRILLKLINFAWLLMKGRRRLYRKLGKVQRITVKN